MNRSSCPCIRWIRPDPLGPPFLMAASPSVLDAGPAATETKRTRANGTRIALPRDPTIARDLSSSERPMAKDRIYETEDGIRIAPLSALDDFEVAEGYPDIRDWHVTSADGQGGRPGARPADRRRPHAHALPRRPTHEGARFVAERPRRARPDRHGGAGGGEGPGARAADRGAVRAASGVRAPAHAHARARGATPLLARRGGRSGGDGHDGRRRDGQLLRRRGLRRPPFLRQAPSDATDEELAARRVDAERADAARVDIEEDVRTRESEIRVPVERDDAVVLKRGEDGRDEIIIRRPIGEKRVEP